MTSSSAPVIAALRRIAVAPVRPALDPRLGCPRIGRARRRNARVGEVVAVDRLVALSRAVAVAVLLSTARQSASARATRWARTSSPASATPSALLSRSRPRDSPPAALQERRRPGVARAAIGIELAVDRMVALAGRLNCSRVKPRRRASWRYRRRRRRAAASRSASSGHRGSAAGNAGDGDQHGRILSIDRQPTKRPRGRSSAAVINQGDTVGRN